jgi:2-hydroxychromene-2-carboxylate isomerase
MSTVQPTFYFSLRSPYSWLAWHDLKVAYPKLLARLRLVPFWEPDAAYQAALGTSGDAFLYTAMSKEKHLYILTDVKRLAAKRGMVPSWPIDKAPVWEVPHLAWIHADAHGQGPAFIERVSAARWRHGQDICDPEVIAAIGAELGLDAAVLHGAASNPALREAGLLHLKTCIRDGAFGVPFFAIGRDKFWGIDRLPDFIGAVAHASAPQPPVEAPVEQPNRALLDHAGGCG